jgi:hypothetical protein
MLYLGFIIFKAEFAQCKMALLERQKQALRTEKQRYIFHNDCIFSLISCLLCVMVNVSQDLLLTYSNFPLDKLEGILSENFFQYGLPS